VRCKIDQVRSLASNHSHSNLWDMGNDSSVRCYHGVFIGVSISNVMSRNVLQ